MICNNCGEKIESGAKFCTKCGSKIVSENNETTENKEGFGIASMVLGIISLILCFFINIATLPLSITGLIFGIINKAKKGKKISGIILNSISIVLSIIIVIVLIVVGIGIFGTFLEKAANDPNFKNEIKEGLDNFEREMDRQTSDNYVSGDYNCKSFDGTGPGTEYIVRFELDDDMSFMWGKYGDTKMNYVKGTYTFKDLEKKNYAGNYSYYTVTLNGNEFYQDGIKQSNPYASEYEFGITKENSKKQGILMNTKTQNMYYCYEE